MKRNNSLIVIDSGLLYFWKGKSNWVNSGDRFCRHIGSFLVLLAELVDPLNRHNWADYPEKN